LAPAGEDDDEEEIIMKLGILGCGDFLRWEEEPLNASERVQVKALYDPNRERAESWADRLGATAAASEDEILADPEIDLVSLFVPPWLRKDLFVRAAEHGKHLLPTKPLGNTAEACDAMVEAVRGNGVRCGVIYRYAGQPWFDAVKSLLEEGSFGRLALFRQDWIHHYPQWADWALDPEKNGGPFMDAMIHNLNIARYFMARPMKAATWFSDTLAHPDLPCPDTECLKVDFEGGGVAHLFITWAAELAVHSTEGNYREHIDLLYLVTDQGWHITEETKDGHALVRLSRLGQDEWIEPHPLPETHYDRFADAIESGAPNPRDLPDVENAAEDVRLIRSFGGQSFGRRELSAAR
jgi:predicted dehydrogenase